MMSASGQRSFCNATQLREAGVLQTCARLGSPGVFGVNGWWASLHNVSSKRWFQRTTGSTGQVVTAVF
jgi:hypothetical protein